METIAVDSLTDRQQRFVFEYLKDQNASAAAERAGYSARSRASQAGELMQNAAVRERIRIEMGSLLAELRLSALDLMKERMRAAFFRAGKLFDASGRPLGFEEMEAELRDSLVIGGKWRKGVPEVRFRMPNREPALRALERVHERLEKLNEAHYAALEKEKRKEAPLSAGQGAVPAGMWTALNPEQPVPAPVQEGGGQGAAPAPETRQDSVENSRVPQGDFVQGVFSGSASTAVVQTLAQAEELVGGRAGAPAAAPAQTAPADDFAEISQVFSGSPEKPAAPEVEKAAKPSLLSKALAALSPGKKEAPPEFASAPLPVRGALNPGAPLIKRHDPELMWGGKRQPTPAPEPSPALVEHLARLRHAELAAEVRCEMEARGGRIKPGPLRPQGLPPGYNPPWLRDDRPRFAIGAGECSMDD